MLEKKTLVRLTINSLCVAIVVILVIVVVFRFLRIASTSASEHVAQVDKPVFVYKPSADYVTPAQVAMDYQLQFNLYILRNGFLTGTSAVTTCVENACKAAYTLAQLKAGFDRNTGMGGQVSQIRPLAPLRQMPNVAYIDDM